MKKNHLADPQESPEEGEQKNTTLYNQLVKMSTFRSNVFSVQFNSTTLRIVFVFTQDIVFNPAGYNPNPDFLT